MAAIDLSGHWKGLAVGHHTHTVVHVYIEQTGSELKGKFESPELPGGNSKGDLTGKLLDNGAVTLEVPGKVAFRGQVVGAEAKDHMIYGLMQAADEQVPGGTLTLFRGVTGGMAKMYK